MQSPDSELGTCAIAHLPAGYDPREGERFTALQAEIDKLASMHASGSLDWSAIATLASQYLREEAKDLTVAVWLAAAWLHTFGGPGAIASGRVLNDLVRTHWETLLPLRPRARRNQLAWLEGIVERFMGAETPRVPLSEADYAELLQQWRELDAAWKVADDEAPSFASFAQRFSQWPVAEAITVASTEISSEAPPPLESPPPVAAVVTPPPAPPRPVVDASPAVPITINMGTTWESADALERELDQALDAIGDALEAGMRDFTSHALWYRLNRVRVWSALETAPTSQQGETRIPGPHERQRDTLAQLLSGTDYAATIAFAESQLIASRFWLDLNFASFTALSQLPDGTSAAQAVAQETTALVARMPTLIKLAFADGTPFANEQTQTWISRLSPNQSNIAVNVVAEPNSAQKTSRQPSLRQSSPTGSLLALSATIAAATAQTESAQALLHAALSRLHDSALQVASHALTEHQSS